MNITVNGVYENGQVIFTDPVPVTRKSKVKVEFLEEERPNAEVRRPGFLKELADAQGIVLPPLPDDFNDPLDDLADYM